MNSRIVAFVLCIMGLFSGAAGAYPTPAVVQGTDQWTLHVTYTQPRQIMFRVGDTDQIQRYWYVILTVTNDGPFDEVPFYPYCELVTDTFQVIPAGKDVPVAVFDAIKLENQGSFPFLESLDFTDRRIARGPDNTRDFAIIWPDFDPKAKQVSLFIAGLSNETAAIELPEAKDAQGNPKKIFLRKTLQLKYSIAGDEKLRAQAVMKEIGQDWVMR